MHIETYSRPQLVWCRLTYHHAFEIVLQHKEPDGKVEVGAVGLVLAEDFLAAAVVLEVKLREVFAVVAVVPRR